MKCSFAPRTILKTSRTIVIICLLGILLPFVGKAEIVDKVLAVVNDEVITLSEVEEEMARVMNALAKESPDKSPADSLDEAREMTLNSLIERRLIHQRAKANKITVEDAELDAAYESTRSRMALNPEEFKKKLERSGMTEAALKKQLGDQVLQSKLVSYEVRSKIVITEEMIRDYYNKNYNTGQDKESLYLLQMGFLWNPEITDPDKFREEKEETKKRAEKALLLVNKGEDFKTVAKKFSDLPSASDGGDLGVLKLEDMAATMRTAVAALEIDAISEIIETSDGYQFFKRLAATDQSSSLYEKVKEDIREKLYNEKLKDAFAEWVKSLKENAYIQKL